MEDDPRRNRRRSIPPSSVAISTKFDAISIANQRRSSDSSTLSDHADSELVSFKLCSPMYYTSLKDLLPSIPSLLSPTLAAGSSVTTISATSTSSSSGCGEISIRNHLVKQAAWAYLQPMSSSPTASSRRLCSYFSLHFIRRLLSSVKRSVVDWAAHVASCFSDALWLILCR